MSSVTAAAAVAVVGKPPAGVDTQKPNTPGPDLL